MHKMPSLNDTVTKIYEQYENTQEDSRRPHLGASLIGEECKRKLWYIFRWIERQHHDGRLLRLFDTGNHAEPRFVKDMRDIGIEVHDVNPKGDQWRVSDDTGHFGGSMDGCAKGLPEAPSTWHVVEFKTHGDKSFTDLAGKLVKPPSHKYPVRQGGKGVRQSKPQHYAQMQIYMGFTGMKRAFYLAVNKNTD